VNAGNRGQLADFLRSRRARLTPADVGLPGDSEPGRRRTPGLRREEVAELSGVGVTWYTWLEQGRQINASTQVLDAVASTLRLDRAEREHLYRLAEATPLRSESAGARPCRPRADRSKGELAVDLYERSEICGACAQHLERVVTEELVTSADQHPA